MPLPPISSTTMSISGFAITARASATTSAASPTMRARARGVEVGDHRDLGCRGRRGAGSLPGCAQHVEGAAADGADAEQADLDRFHGGRIGAFRAFSASGACGSARGNVAMRPIASVRSSEFGRKTTRKWSGVGPVEAGALHDQHLLLGEQLVGELLVVLDRVDLRVEPREHVERRLRLDARSRRGSRVSSS